MKKSKLLTLLSSFSKDEMKSFGKFIESPYFNSERNFKPVFNILRTNHPAFDDPKLTEEKIFKLLYPDKSFNKNSALSVRVLFSQLSVLAEKFLSIEGFNKNDAFKSSCLLRELHLKRLFDMFLSAKSKMKDENFINRFDYTNLLKTLLIETEIISWPKYKNTNDEGERFKDFNIFEETLIVFFLHNITEINQRWNKDYDKNSFRSDLSRKFFKSFDLKKFIESLKDSEELNSVWLRIIYYSYKIEEDNNFEEGYVFLKKSFYNNQKKLSLGIRNEMLIRLMNYCIFQSKGNRKKYNEDYLKYYRILVEDNLTSMEHEVFGIRQIRNYVRICCRLKKYNELEKFMDKYSEYISDSIREDCINYAKASVEFSKNRNCKALEFLSIINFSIPMMVKDIKIFKLKCYYELGYYDLLRSEVDNYRHFLKTARAIPKNLVNSDKIFMVYLIKLSKIRECNKQEELINLRKELKAASLNDHIIWILEKADEMYLKDSKNLTRLKNVRVLQP